MIIFPFSTAITVDSNPIKESPPSITNSILPSISWRTASAVVGLGFVEIFALGPAIGTPAARINALAAS